MLLLEKDYLSSFRAASIDQSESRQSSPFWTLAKFEKLTIWMIDEGVILLSEFMLDRLYPSQKIICSLTRKWKEVHRRWQLNLNFRIWTKNVGCENWQTSWWKVQLTSVWLSAKHWSLPIRSSPSPSPLERKLSSLTTGNWQPAPGSTRRRSPLARFGGKRRGGRLENQKSLKKWLSFQHVLHLKS